MTAPKIAKAFPFFLCIFLLLSQQGSRALPLATDGLKFFNNFFVTGDVVVGGVGTWGTGSGTIHMGSPAPPMSAAPEGAEALAAFLYWQVVTSANPTAVDVNAGATFNGLPLNVPTGTQLPPTSDGVAVGTQACLLNGGTSKRVHTFRSDVLRFLDVDPATGRRVINKVDGYPVAFPNNGTTRTLGASLVVIYRHPDPAWPLNAIVITDGTFVKQQSATLHQRIEGFYDPKSVQGQITYIAGSAQSGLGERLTGPFTPRNGLFSGASGNAWDNVTVATNALAAGTTYFDTAIAPQTSGPLGFLVNDCIAMGAMIYRTQVNDTDEDGLLDLWESSASTLYDPKGQPLPRLKAMGADKDVKDIFIEIGAMQAPAGTTYGSEEAPLSSTLHSVTDPLGHKHLPPPAVLQMLGDAFAAKNIRLHFDVGLPSGYKALRAYPTQPPADSPYNSIVADTYIIGAGGSSGSDPALARGGELINETACDPAPGSGGSPEVDCQFPDYPGTVSWKTGFQLYKEHLFDANRKDSFRYVFYAHSKASPKSLFPCLAPALGGAVFDENNDCANGIDPLFHVPGGVSGSGEYPGGDFLVTLGLWDNTNFVGSDFGIASTTMHELGHTLDLGHGGTSLPNCKPNYLSVMNYSFQLGGLIDVNGVPHLGYSESAPPQINETGVSDGYALPGSPGPYRTSWYAPKPPGDTRTVAKRYCNGQKFDPLFPPVDTVRIDSSFDPVTKAPIPIDWNANGAVDAPYPQDVNFDGGSATALEGYDDWAHLRLNQVGSRRNFGGLSIGPLGVQLLSDGSQLLADGSQLLADGNRRFTDGSVFLADGSVLLADGSVLLADGAVLLADGVQLLSDGSVLLADGSVLLADGARLLSGGSVLLADGSVFLADGSVFLADGVVLLADGVQLLSDGLSLANGSVLLADGATLAWEFTEPTPQVAAESGITAGPHSLTACVIGGTGVSACLPGPPSNPPSEPLHRVWLDWEAPIGNVDHYWVYRVEGDTITPLSVAERTQVPASQTSLLDDTELPNGIHFTYVVEAVLDDAAHTVTPRSNEKSITAVNVKPIAYSQSVGVWEDWLSDTITLTAFDPDSAGLAFSVDASSAAGGTVTGTPPTVKYKSATNYNGPDSFTFKVKETSTWIAPVAGIDRNQQSDPGTVSLTVSPVNDKPNFTKGLNQTVTQPVGTQTVVGWATGFDAGPPDEDLSQAVLQYIVSNNNSGLFEDGGQPAIASNGTLTYTPKVGASSSVPVTVTVQVQDNGGTLEGHGAVDTSDPKTFTITINPPVVVTTLTSAGPADVWFSNSSTSSSSTSNKYDLKAEVLKDGTVVTSGELKGVSLSYNGTSFSKAVLKVIGLSPTTLSPGVPFGAGQALRLRVSVRYVSGTPVTGSLRLWFNTPVAADNTSHLHAKLGGPDIRYHLVGLAPTHSETTFLLQKGTVPSGPTQYVERTSLTKVGSSGAYTVLGTWSITGP